jgi:hypothetical protein
VEEGKKFLTEDVHHRCSVGSMVSMTDFEGVA